MPEALAGPPVGSRSQRQKDDALLKQMEQVRDRKLPMWMECQSFIAPYSSNVARNVRIPTAVSVDVLDETIFYGRLTFQSFLASALTNPSRIWSEWTLPDPELNDQPAAKDWLHTVNTRRMTILSQSNFYETMKWVYGEWPVFATAVVLVEEDEQDVIRYVPWEIGSYAIADDAKGHPVCLSRRLQMTVRQCCERFATKPDGTINESLFSTHVRNLIRAEQWEAEVEVAHLICPNDEYRQDSGVGRYMRFASRYWEYGRAEPGTGEAGYLAREGYHEWPAMVFRWSRLAGDPWGTDSPGYLTLGAVKSAQAMESDHLMMIEKSVKPPMIVPSDLLSVNLLPGAVNKATTRPGMLAGPIHETEATAIQQARESQGDVRERILTLWYTRLILSSNVRETSLQGGSTQPRTAREIDEISAEKYQILGPVVEAAAPAFRVGSDREFGILQRRGFLPPAPPEIEGQPLAIEYTSALGIAQRSVGLASLYEYGMRQAELFKLTGDQSILDRTNWSELAQATGDRSGLPPKVQRSDDEVAAIQRSRAEAQAAAAQAEQMAITAKATKELGTTPMDGDSALTRIAQQANGTAAGTGP